MKITSLKSSLSVSALFLAIGILAANAFPQFSQVDPTFQAVPSKAPVAPPTGSSKGQILQPDGKVIVWGGNIVIAGAAKGQIARLNSDGSLDNSFHHCSCYLSAFTNVALQPDGRILVAGYDSAGAKLLRLNADGSTDLSYNPVFPAPANSWSYVWHVQADGKPYVEIYQSTLGLASRTIYRVNLDGSLDGTFTPISAGGGRSVQAFPADFLEYGGKLYRVLNTITGGGWGSADIKRFNLDGTSDSGFQSPSFQTGTFVSDIDFQADGSMIISGRFSSINGFSKTNIARLLAAGNVDLAFTGPSAFDGGFVKTLSSGKLLWSPTVDFGGQHVFYRLNNDGSIDGTFVDPPSVGFRDSRWVIDQTERIYFYGDDAKFHRLNPNGDIDATFAPDVEEFGQVFSIGRQTDGKLIIGGVFTKVNGVLESSIARINSDGSLDTTFNAGSGFDQPPTQMLVQSDGKILAIGPFTTYNGTSRTGILRINTDGTLDASFVTQVTDVKAMALQSDGKILIGGGFTSVNGVGKSYLARLLVGGGLDDTFTTVVGCCTVYDLLIQSDGKIVIAGGFSGVDGFSRPNLARLMPTGALDTTLNATGTGLITKVAVQPGDKYLIITAPPASTIQIRRRNGDGSADNSFPLINIDESGSNASVDSILVETSGSFIVGGKFFAINGGRRNNFARFAPNGTLDGLFFPRGADGRVRSLVADSGGRVLIGGDFATVENSSRAGIARLNVVPFRRPAMFDFDGDGRSDISVFRPSTNRWYEVFSSTGAPYEETFGVAGDILAPADFDGDGITDEAIYRPSSGQWWFRSSLNGSLVLNQFGTSADVPRPSDFDGDGKADFVLYRPSNNFWYRVGSLTPQQQEQPVLFGIAGDQPLVGDFDGDGRSDLAVFRPSNGDWWYAASSNGGAFVNVHWGQNGDIPVPADYDGDGKTDYAIFRPSDGGWYIYNSSNGSFTTTAFGTVGDRPVAADYDGDGRADIAVFRPSTGIWYLLRSTSGFAGYQFGISTDIAIPGSLIP
jgi:uncharacterized delta-60 repeat protein